MLQNNCTFLLPVLPKLIISNTAQNGSWLIMHEDNWYKINKIILLNPVKHNDCSHLSVKFNKYIKTKNLTLYGRNKQIDFIWPSVKDSWLYQGYIKNSGPLIIKQYIVLHGRIIWIKITLLVFSYKRNRLSLYAAWPESACFQPGSCIRYLFRSRNFKDCSTCVALQALEQGRIYALRYKMCDDMARSPDLTDRDPRRKMWNFLSPIALFASKGNKNGKNELVPVAIQMDYKPGKMLNSCDWLKMSNTLN